MNLLGYEEEENNSGNKKSRKVVLFSIIGCTVLLVMLLILIIYISYLDSKKLKVYINEKQISITDSLFKYSNDGKIEYVSIKELAEKVGYTYFNGEYGTYTEDKNSCYIENDNEVVSFVADADIIKKYVTDSVVNISSKKEVKKDKDNEEAITTSLEIFEIENQVKLYDESLYVPWELAKKSFNVYIVEDGMKIKIYTLQALAESYNTQAQNLQYDGLSLNFKNVRAIADNMLIVVKDGQYAVLDMNKNYEVIVGKKYDDLEYIQNTQEFIVTANGNVGLLSSKGETKITPNTQYKSIELLDVRKDLYVVQQSGKYGVLNGNGKAVVPADFDKIGIENITALGTDNTKLLFDNLIPVQKDEKWGFYDVRGNYILKANYDSIGYTKQESDESSVKDTVIIPKEVGVEGIVVSLSGYYGLIDSTGKIVIPLTCSKIYAQSKLGETTYYYQIGKTSDLLENLISQNLKNSSENNDSEEN